jgi:hypothetical protein
MRSLILAAGAAAALAVLPAFAQAPSGGAPPAMAAPMPPAAPPPQGVPTNVRGTITKLSGQTLTLKGRDGKTITVALTPDFVVRAYARKKLSDIHDGDYIASTSMKESDGKLHAIEVHFLPPNVPELQGPWDLRKDSVMTNAHVTGMAKVTGGTDIALVYKGSNTTDVVIGPKTVIVGPTPATVADVKAGKSVFVRALKRPDGTLLANAVAVEKNGVKPPM